MQYWLNPQIDEAKRRKGRLDYAGGNQLGRVNSGDEVWIVTVRPDKGKLITIGRIVVDERLGRKAARRKRNNLWDASNHIFAQRDNAERPEEVCLMDIVHKIRFESDRDRLILRKRGRVNGQQLQTLRELTRKSADLIARQWQERP